MDEVHQGRDGWLFLMGGSNAVHRYYTDLDYFSHRDHVERWVELLRRRSEIFAKAQIRYLHVFAPDKISVYPERVLMPLPFFARHPINLIAMEWAERGLPPVLINPLPGFAAHPRRDSLWLRTDTHWSYHAGQMVVEMVLAAIGHPRALSLKGREVARYRHVWDLAGKLPVPVDEENIFVAPSPHVKRVRTNAVAQAFESRIAEGRSVVHGSIAVVFHNDSPDAIDETVVIFGDSYFEFRPSTPTFLFAEQFREVHFVWSANIDYSYVARADATLVITEMAERFMIQVPHDIYDVESDADAKMRDYASAE